MLILRIILIPFSLIYCCLIFIRNKFYDWKIFKTNRISKPVISLGNLTTGGTGKTPLTIHLAKYILEKNKTVGIVSRGYKRKSEEILIVSDGNSVNENIDDSGDELIVISNALSENYGNKFFIAAGKDRVKASELLIYKFNPDVIILDDGFQHRKIHRDLDIVLIDAKDFISEKFENKFTLPSGNLRESFSNIKRADFIVQNNKSSDIKKLNFVNFPGKDIAVMRYKWEYFIDYKNGILLEKDLAKEAIVFSGIANDDSFIEMILQKGIKISMKLTFADHYDYSKNDIDNLKNKSDSEKIYITTEKDFVKLKQHKDFIENYPVYYMKINTEITENREELFRKTDGILR